MRPRHSAGSEWIFYTGILAMVLLIIGILQQPSSLPQKSLFLVGSVLLAAVAYLNKQTMLLSLQVIIVIGSALAFIQLGGAQKYGILAMASILAIIYLISIKNFKKDPWSIICTLGLILIAVGYVTDATVNPLFFGLSLGLGSVLVALYSFMDYYFQKDHVAVIWFILNLVFAINPLLIAISAMKAS